MIKKIIVNADDFGLAKEFNKGIIDLAKQGFVTSTTILINRKHTGKYWFLSLNEYSKAPISVGLHLEIADNASVKEIEEQISKFKQKTGFLPSHLDGHNHCHLTKNNLPIVIKVAKKYNFPLRSSALSNRRLIKKEKIKTPDKFISWHPIRKESLFKELKKNNSEITEMVCHPGYRDQKTLYPYNKQREEEIKVFKSENFRELIRGYQMVNYKVFL
ncbi:MAG: ChbG/HpnK family deacetylase [Candidatus Moraniibacteriota bacterium]